MKITVKLSPAEAQQVLGKALAAAIGGDRKYNVEEVSWSSYGSTVEIELSDDPIKLDEPSDAAA